MWYYSTNGKQQGPINDIGLDKLIADGTVHADTYVWKEGMAEWAPLSQARPGGSAGVVSNAGTAREACSICGKQVGSDNLIDLLGNRVCAECKPIAVQSLKEGASIHSRTSTAWRAGKKVVAFDKTALPARCFKCNHDTVGAPLTRKLYWHHPAWYLLLILRFLPYLIVAIFVRKRATLDLYLCEEHRQRRLYYIIGSWSGVVAGIFLIIGSGVFHQPWLIGLGILVILGAIIASIVGARSAYASKIKKDGTVWLNGAGKEFVASLPEWTGPAR